MFSDTGSGYKIRKETYKHLKKHSYLLAVDVVNGLVLNKKTHLSGNGYYHLSLKNKKITVHAIIAFLVYGEDVIGRTVNHLNGIKTDNRLSNLEVTTYSGNAIHAHEFGLRKAPRLTGEDHGKSKLKEVEVKEIKKLLKSGHYSHSKIAAMYGISSSTIGQINRGVTWSHVT